MAKFDSRSNYFLRSLQDSLYTDCVESLINGALKGYNATVLAYGKV